MLAVNFPTPPAWTLGPRKCSRGKGFILEISRLNAAKRIKGGSYPPLLHDSPLLPHCPSPQEVAVALSPGAAVGQPSRAPRPASWHSLRSLSQRLTASALEKNIFIFQVFISSAFKCLERLISEDHHSLGQQERTLTLIPALITLPPLVHCNNV